MVVVLFMNMLLVVYDSESVNRKRCNVTFEQGANNFKFVLLHIIRWSICRDTGNCAPRAAPLTCAHVVTSDRESTKG